MFELCTNFIIFNCTEKTIADCGMGLFSRKGNGLAVQPMNAAPTSAPPTDESAHQEQGRELCSTCKPYYSVFNGVVKLSRNAMKAADYGTPNQIRARIRCPICRLICQLMPAWLPDQEASVVNRIRLEGYDIAGMRVVRLGPHVLGQLSELNHGPAALLRGPVYDELDADAVEAWLANCEINHPPAAGRLTQDSSMEITLIDVIDGRLVRGSTRSRYFALSYVWGNDKPGLVCTTANRTGLGEKNSLFKRQDVMSKTVQDAIALTSKLHERYLWVDRLCIEQDNISQKRYQIARMDLIYEKGLATIIALSAYHSSCGLASIRPSTSLPVEAEERVNIGRSQGSFGIVPPDLASVEKFGRYETRAWTFQERLVSRRCLLFTEQRMYAYCDGTVYSTADTRRGGTVCLIPVNEGKQYGTYEGLYRSLRPDTAIHWLDAFRVYSWTVSQYTARRLSLDTDRLNAISGIVSRIGNAAGCNTSTGLLDLVLDLCLLWHQEPVYMDSQPRRRIKQFPSWSWAGWHGRCEYFDGPLTNISFTGDDYSRSRLSDQFDRFHDYYPLTETMTIAAPSGYRRVERLSSYVSQERTSRKVSQTSTRQESPQQALHFYTHAVNAAIFAFQLRDEGPAGDVHKMGIRFANNGDLCGQFWTDYDERAPIYSKRDRCEYILLSSTKCRFERDEEDMEVTGMNLSRAQLATKFPRLQDRRVWLEKKNISWWLGMNGNFCNEKDCRFYNVMLIQWTGQTAERLGIGLIHGNAWEQVPKTKKKIVLV